MTDDDPLLSARGVARLYGTGISTVVDLVSARTLPSLDGGKMIAGGHLDLPLIRQSWATHLQRASPGAERIVPPPDGEELHPAVIAALEFHSAMQTGDSSSIYELSSTASKTGRTPEELMRRWQDITGGLPEDSGVGSVAYSLAPLPAMAARVFAEAPSAPRAVDKPTPASLLMVLPLVEGEGSWRVDLPLFEGPADLVTLVAQPLPSDSSSDSRSAET